MNGAFALRSARVTGIVLACVLGLAHAAGAATWSAQTVPPRLGANGALIGISCNGSTCEAVGTNVSSGGNQVTLAEKWTGSQWTIQSTPSPAGNTFNELTAVSCSAADACSALETYNYAYLFGNTFLYAERWNGTAWSLEKLNLPSSEYGVLNSISCASATACVAVGSYGASPANIKQHPLVEFFNGQGWTAQTAPTPSGDTSVYLNGVSCKLKPTSSTAYGCVAVGGAVNSSTGAGALAEVWNGSSWTSKTPASAANSVLNGISCTAATTCVAVGQASASTGLAERLNGTTWTAATVSGTYSLNSVSCSGASACSAIGQYGPVIERWDGSGWNSQTPASTGSTPANLVAISCPGPGACKAVGATGSGFSGADPRAYQGGEGQTVAEAWSGSGWTRQTTLNRTGAENISPGGVDCVSSTSDCVYVGSYTNIAQQSALPFSEVNTGSGWKLVGVPAGSSVSPSTVLNGVSCPANGSCMVVGDQKLDSGDGFYASWNGTSWTSGMILPPSPGANMILTSVSCPSTSSCVAVGIYDNGAVQTMLSENWSGSTGKWTQHIISAPSGASQPLLSGVSCTSATVCEAVGTYQDSGGVYTALAERWNGSSWTQKTVPEPANTTEGELFGVDCPKSSSACTAAGLYDAPPNYGLLLERWSGSSWSEQGSPSGLYNAYAVSCPTAGACTAVTSNGSTDWAGTSWSSAVPYATPTDGGSPGISSVSCTAAQACIGGGVSDHALAAVLPLIESYS